MKYMLKPFILTLALLLCVSGIAQEKKLEKANKKFDEFSFIDAREAYREVANDGYRSEDLLKKLGDSYYFTADYDQAAIWYGALYDYSEGLDSEYLYRYALSLKSDRQYEESDQIMEELYNKRGDDYRAKLFVDERNYLEEIELQSGRFELVNVPFNSEMSDFAPAFRQGNIVFASNRKGRHATQRIHDWNEEPFLDLYGISNTTEAMNGENGPAALESAINTAYHESTAVFTRDGMTMYFTRNNFTDRNYKEDSNGTNRLKLYKATLLDSKWTVVELPFNSDEYSVAHPALSNDEKTLYFASDMPGGKGMSDLYKVDILGDDSYGTPVSLGDKINTEARETFPFVSREDKFYFASDGHVGLGGLDVFVTDIEGDSFGEVFNVGKPVNSIDDDFTFIINSNNGRGYFASNRAGGMGNDDIYSFRRIKAPITKCAQTLNSIVLDVETDEPIVGAEVLLLDDSGKEIAKAITKSDGSFTAPLNCNTQYSIRASKKDYNTAEKSFAVNNKLNGVVERILFLKKGRDLSEPVALTPGVDLGKLLYLNPIYFDLDKSFIRPDAEIELRKVIAAMKQYPSLKIDVRSHTDSRADDDYNIALSQRRNVSTIDYIVMQGGIDRNRLTGRGYGETQLTNGCINGAVCSEAAHQLNRRSEFIIIE